MMYFTRFHALIALSLVLTLGACEGKADKAPTTNMAEDKTSSTPTSAPGEKPESMSASVPVENGPLEAVGKDKLYKFTLRFTPEEPRIGELFKVDTTVLDVVTNAPVTGLRFGLDATMPHHKHGMMTRPLHKEVGGGLYQSEGMKLHMAGRWEFKVDAYKEGAEDHAIIIWNQSPTSNLVAPAGSPGK